MYTAFKLGALAVVMVFAAIAANWGHDLAFQVNAFVVLAAASAAFLWIMFGDDTGAHHVILVT